MVEVIAAAFFTWRAWQASSDFVAAAARIDELVEAQQEVVTLATLANPAKPVTARGTLAALSAAVAAGDRLSR